MGRQDDVRRARRAFRRTHRRPTSRRRRRVRNEQRQSAFSPLWVYDPTAFGTASVLNFANVFRTKGAAGNGTAANANFVGGKQIVNPQRELRRSADALRVRRARGALRHRSDRLAVFQLPSQRTTNFWSGGKPTQAQVAKDFSLTLNHHIGDSLFFEIAGDTNKVKVNGNNAVNRGLNTEYIDITQTLPNGATNPYFLHPYTEFWTYENQRWYELRSARAAVAYVKDIGIGKLQLGVDGRRQLPAPGKAQLSLLAAARKVSGPTRVSGTPRRRMPHSGIASISIRADAISTAPISGR